MSYLMRKKRAGAIKRVREGFNRKAENEILILLTGRNVYAQIVNFKSGKTLCCVSSVKNGNKKNNRNIKTATIVGQELASKCKSLGVSDVVFNRAENRFCGVVKAVADGFYNSLS